MSRSSQKVKKRDQNKVDAEFLILVMIFGFTVGLKTILDLALLAQLKDNYKTEVATVQILMAIIMIPHSFKFVYAFFIGHNGFSHAS